MVPDNHPRNKHQAISRKQRCENLSWADFCFRREDISKIRQINRQSSFHWDKPHRVFTVTPWSFRYRLHPEYRLKTALSPIIRRTSFVQHTGETALHEPPHVLPRYALQRLKDCGVVTFPDSFNGRDIVPPTLPVCRHERNDRFHNALCPQNRFSALQRG